MAKIAGIHPSYLALVERGAREPSGAVLGRIGAALGADVSLRLYPSTGPPIRDRLQAPMVEALLRDASPRWLRFPEVAVFRPARGVIDLVLGDPPTCCVVSVEAHSDIYRLEQQIRWAGEKSDSLPSSTIWPGIERRSPGPPRIHRLLLLRSTTRTRELARTFAATIGAAYPADPVAIREALADPTRPWPGNGILWVRVEAGKAVLLERRPRGVPTFP